MTSQRHHFLMSPDSSQAVHWGMMHWICWIKKKIHKYFKHLIERFVGLSCSFLFKILMVLLYSVNEAAHQNCLFFGRWILVTPRRSKRFGK
jgi:hypothetical protein